MLAFVFQLNPPININAKCESGNTALYVAVAQNNLVLAKLLLDDGGALVDITNTNCDAATPLHMAALFGYSGMVNLLVEDSARLDIRTISDHRDGLTASELAQFTENERLSAQLCKLATDVAAPFVNDQTFNHLLVRQTILDGVRKNFNSAQPEIKYKYNTKVKPKKSMV
ncbi:uncharacterized protein DEA37_0009754 [Paragonimus westermani]|uniref:Uncharacterized protein n=1 Tax=Paragonimus westermani TaxID=34504 RepID=A0A5J4NZ66_9TREM|nr:uncharacterized protein DEA37_0009754 [Paragonimus westermani]